MKPFLVLQLRPEDEASDDEFRAFLKYGGLSEDNVHRVRMERESIPEINLDDYSGVIVGGGPFNVSDKEEEKSEDQLRAERDMNRLLDEVVERDFPYLGSCYGIGILAKHSGATVSKEKYSEPVGAIDVALTEEGKKDPLLLGLPDSFRALGGHKEACQNASEGLVVLAGSEGCPFQIVRVGKNIYGTQFHVELDSAGIITRIKIYKHAGYFAPEEEQELIENAKKEEGKIKVPMKILRRFVGKYGR